MYKITKNFTILLLLVILILPMSSVSVSAQNINDSSLLDYTFHRKGNSDYFLNTNKANLLTGDTLTLSIEGISDEDTSFKSENSSVVSINSTTDSSCVLKAISVGDTVVTVKVKKSGSFFFNGSTTTLRCNVNVSPIAASVRFKKNTYKLQVGAKRKTAITLRPSITTERPLYSISNNRIATVSAKGKLLGKVAGTTVLTARIRNGKTAQCKVIVTAHND